MPKIIKVAGISRSYTKMTVTQFFGGKGKGDTVYKTIFESCVLGFDLKGRL